MFTGLIEHVGTVLAVRAAGGGKELTIDLGPLAEDLQPGGSVAIDGTCLTVRNVKGPAPVFEVVGATLSTTTLGEFVVGRLVNLERPITLSDRLGGHLVQGHIDGTASLAEWTGRGASRMARFEAPKKLTDYMIPRGSLAVNGVSLTIADLTDGSFAVALIGETLAATNLGALQTGQSVNIETDLIGKYVAKFLAGGRNGGLSLETLREHGFA